MSGCPAVMVGDWIKVECGLALGHEGSHSTGYQWPNDARYGWLTRADVEADDAA